MPGILERLSRRKFVTFGESALPRVLTLVDLTALGIGSTVGVGFYVLAGDVARNIAGPSVTLCFLIAGIASVFSGICYAEFGARVPKSGSAYIYSYVCVGEFVAFVVGWNLILEYVIGAASVASGYSKYIDKLANNTISSTLEELMPIGGAGLSEYPDFLAFGLAMLLSIILAFGVKESSMMNNVFTLINLFVIAYVIIAGATKGYVHNWSLEPDEISNVNKTGICQNESVPTIDSDDVNKDWGVGGFFPYGFNGVMKGAAACFFGFVGFDVIATTGEEAINPHRSIPLSIALSLLFVFIAYFGMSTVITLALPYCLQDPNASLIFLFEYHGMEVSKWIVSIGALFGFSASLFGAMFPLPRIIYSMADDGLLFRFLSHINKRNKSPVIATILSGLFAGIMALVFNLESLVQMMSIGTLMAYSIVSICVMLLRYTDLEVTNWSCEYTLLRYAEEDGTEGGGTKSHNTTKVPQQKQQQQQQQQLTSSISFSINDYIHQMFNTKNLREPTPLSAALTSYATLVYCVMAFVLSILLVLLGNSLYEGDIGSIILVSLVFLFNLTNVIIIARQPQSKKKLSFKVPFVPWIPAFSTFFNFYLMCNLDPKTWLRFVIWMAIGLVLYTSYSIKNSSGEYRMRGETPPTLNRHIDLQRLGTFFDDTEDEEEDIYLKPPKQNNSNKSLNTGRLQYDNIDEPNDEYDEHKTLFAL